MWLKFKESNFLLAFCLLVYSTVLADDTEQTGKHFEHLISDNDSVENVLIDNGDANIENKLLDNIMTELNDLSTESSPDEINDKQGEEDINLQNLQPEQINETLFANETVPENLARFNCTPVYRDETNNTARLILINQTTIDHYQHLKALMNVPVWSLSIASLPSNSVKTEPGECALLVFYLSWCPFSAAAAPHLNAIGRIFPQFNILAIDAYEFYSISMRLGVVGVPNVFLFHTNKLVSRFNKSEPTIDNFVEYIKSLTLLDPIGEVNVTEADLNGPLIIPSSDSNSSILFVLYQYMFVISWIFCFLFFLYYFLRSDLFRKIKEYICNLWHEAEVHHEHID